MRSISTGFVRHIAKRLGDDGQVVLLVVGQRVLAFAPLHDADIIAKPHDRRPDGVAGIIRRAACDPIMVEAEGVAHFMGTGFAHVFGIATSEIICEDETRCINVPGKRANVSDAARRTAQPVRAAAADDDPFAKGQIGTAGHDQRIHARIFSGHIHIKRGIVLRNLLPDQLDVGKFLIAERGGVPVNVIGRRDDIGSGSVGSVPRCSRGRMAMEIEIDFLGRSRPAVEQEGLCERVGWRARRRRTVCRCSCGWWNQSRASIVKTRSPVGPNVLVTIGQLREVG